MISNYYKDLIKQEFVDCTRNTVERTSKRIASPEKTGGLKPFHSRLLTRESIIWSQFERSFSTSFGQRLIERVSRYVSLATGASEAISQKETIVEIDSAYVKAVHEHISALRTKRTGKRGLWETDLSDLIQNTQHTGQMVTEYVISDLWYLRDRTENFVSIKTVQPNIDQTAQAKRDLLLIKLNNPSCNVYFGLYYNPFGDNRADFKAPHASKIFNLVEDNVILVGKQYWDTIGEDGTYDEILQIVESARDESLEIVEEFALQHDISVPKEAID